MLPKRLGRVGSCHGRRNLLLSVQSHAHREGDQYIQGHGTTEDDNKQLANSILWQVDLFRRLSDYVKTHQERRHHNKDRENARGWRGDQRFGVLKITE